MKYQKKHGRRLEVIDDEEDAFLAKKGDKSRSRLHTCSTVSWMRKRFYDSANKRYLFFPEELKRHMEIKRIFRIFDEDASDKLDLKEFLTMMNDANINMDESSLQLIYDLVDKDHDSALNFKEFKECTLSDQANMTFTHIMKGIRNDEFAKYSKNDKDKPFLPLSFASLLTYLTYKTRRDKLLKYIENEDNRARDKVDKLYELLSLHSNKEANLDSQGLIGEVQRQRKEMDSGFFPQDDWQVLDPVQENESNADSDSMHSSIYIQGPNNVIVTNSSNDLPQFLDKIIDDRRTEVRSSNLELKKELDQIVKKTKKSTLKEIQTEFPTRSHAASSSSLYKIRPLTTRDSTISNNFGMPKDVLDFGTPTQRNTPNNRTVPNTPDLSSANLAPKKLFLSKGDSKYETHQASQWKSLTKNSYSNGHQISQGSYYHSNLKDIASPIPHINSAGIHSRESSLPDVLTSRINSPMNQLKSFVQNSDRVGSPQFLNKPISSPIQIEMSDTALNTQSTINMQSSSSRFKDPSLRIRIPTKKSPFILNPLNDEFSTADNDDSKKNTEDTDYSHIPTGLMRTLTDSFTSPRKNLLSPALNAVSARLSKTPSNFTPYAKTDYATTARQTTGTSRSFNLREDTAPQQFIYEDSPDMPQSSQLFNELFRTGFDFEKKAQKGKTVRQPRYSRARDPSGINEGMYSTSKISVKAMPMRQTPREVGEIMQVPTEISKPSGSLTYTQRLRPNTIQQSKPRYQGETKRALNLADQFQGSQLKKVVLQLPSNINKNKLNSS